VTSVGLTTATARALLGRTPRGKAESGRADAVAQQLGDAIRRGILLDGERLPAEPALAAQFGVSTVTLREALAVLRRDGLVVTRRGRGGGTFVVTPDLSAELASRLRELSCAGLRDLGDERAAVSGAAAALAAERALPSEVTAMQEQLGRFAAAVEVGDRRRAGAQLSLAIAAAAQSPRLVQAELQLAAEVGDLLWLGTTDGEHTASVAEHAGLIEAIEARDPAAARARTERRIATETTRLIESRLRAYTAGGTLRRVGADLDDLFARLEDLGVRYAGVLADSARRDDLDDLRPAIFAILADHGDLAAGAGVITAPEVLADAPLWLEWWWTSPPAAPERLRVNLDPDAPDFYDYTTAPWYVLARDSGTPQAVGPYVDHFCTGDYTITLSVPVIAGGVFVGVAAADVLVSSLERQIVPALGPQALISADGRVIASASAELPSGSPAPPDAVTAPGPFPGWRVTRVAGKVGNSTLRPPALTPSGPPASVG
jgi:DNA-binding FadR family transcriptional regulator